MGLLIGDGHIQKRSINGKSRFIYAQSSLRLQHLNYFKHILELFRPYLIKILTLKIEILQIREVIKFIVLLVLPHYLYRVLMIIKIYFIIRII